ncbi:hypothetical protein GMB86_02600 [Terrilactibacillus sp. BCM23-1]|uniref:Sulfotransferase domain-containing protein n=1 Tax=Terrilactibacillus tamarindi TaxID=2599694 RepID=A0A6N8CP67_9BACI|nr:hypothetical protein [Terrilactibacillus tamarindi]MTT30903.1 hypothetical protein [Terrilactibacillus tamarindi]
MINFSFSKDYDIIIDGFPRSANTFSVCAFEEAQIKQVDVGHHSHDPNFIIFGVQNHMPVMLLIRRPEDAILSFAIYANIPVERALDMYIDFYSTVKPHLSGCVVAPFETVTTDFGECIDLVNKKFNTGFMTFNHTKENTDRIFHIMDQQMEILETDHQLIEQKRPMPTQSRSKLKESLSSELHTPQLEEKMKLANQLYEEIITS